MWKASVFMISVSLPEVKYVLMLAFYWSDCFSFQHSANTTSSLEFPINCSESVTTTQSQRSHLKTFKARVGFLVRRRLISEGAKKTPKIPVLCFIGSRTTRPIETRPTTTRPTTTRPTTTRPMDSSPNGQFTPRTVCPTDSSPYGQLAPWTFRPTDSSPPRTVRPTDNSPHGQLAQWTTRPMVGCLVILMGSTTSEIVSHTHTPSMYTVKKKSENFHNFCLWNYTHFSFEVEACTFRNMCLKLKFTF